MFFATFGQEGHIFAEVSYPSFIVPGGPEAAPTLTSSGAGASASPRACYSRRLCRQKQCG